MEERCFGNAVEFTQGGYQVLESQQLKCAKLKGLRSEILNRKTILLKCAICLALVPTYRRRYHCRKHLKEEAGVTWQYLCLLCSERNPLTTIYSESIY